MPIKLFATAVIAALLLAGTALPVSLTPGQGAQSPQPRTETAAATTLTAEEAISIALDHAGLTRTQISCLDWDFDRNRRGPEWDIEFSCNGFEYSYEIHAESGAILDRDKEWDD